MKRGFLSMRQVGMSNDKFLLCFPSCKGTLSILLAGYISVSIVSSVQVQF